MGCGQSG